MRPCVGRLHRKSMAILHAYAHLQRVVVEIGIYRLLVDRTEPWKNSVTVRLQAGSSNQLPICYISNWQGVDRNVRTLVPSSGTDILNNRNQRLSQLPLYTEAEHQSPRWFV